MAQETSLEIRLFGGLQVFVGGEPIGRVRSHSVEWLLALLVLRHGREVPRSWLAGLLWPESSQDQAHLNLRRNLMDLRRALGPAADRLGSPTRDSLRLELTDAEADVAAFDRAIALGDEASVARAVSLYRGPLLEGCAEEWIIPERESRAEACLQALEALADRAAARGEHAEAERYLRQAEAIDPLRDSAQRRLMEVLAARGDTPAAILTFRDYRLRLHREMGVEPDPATAQLFRGLRTGVRRAVLRRPRTNGAAADVRLAAGGGSLAGSPPAPLRDSAPLPRPLTALIGREAAVEEVVQALAASRLVTLAGEGGVGKTRLALEIAEALLERFDDEVAFVELAPLGDPSLVEAYVAEAVGVRESAEGAPGPGSRIRSMVARLGSSPALLVLDNCEHVIEAVAALAAPLLAGCPELRVLATSRQRLGVTGEVVWRVPPLPSPDPGTVPTDDERARAYVLGYPAGQLFVERAAAVRPGFHLGGREETVAVADVCRQLDGIPLAIELAAARVTALTVTRLASRLEDRFRLLTGGRSTAGERHHTLRALIDWSYHLLPEPERALLRRLSVFCGGWSLEAAEGVCADSGCCHVEFGLGRRTPGYSTAEPSDSPAIQHPPSTIQNKEVLDLLTSLVEKSLVVSEIRAGEERYWMLETIREYALEKMEAEGAEGAMLGPAPGGEAAAAYCEHASYFLSLANQAFSAMCRSEGDVWVERLEREHDNLRAALAWCVEAVVSGQWSGDRSAATPGAVESDGKPDRPLSELTTNHPPLSTALELGVALGGALGWFWSARGYLTEGRERLERLVALSSAAPPPPAPDSSLLRHNPFFLRGRLRTFAGSLAYAQGDYETARGHFQESLTLFQQVGDGGLIAWALSHLGSAAREEGDLEAARSFFEETVAIQRQHGTPTGVAQAIGDLATIDLYQGNVERARRLFEEGYALYKALHDKQGMAWGLHALATIARGSGDLTSARSLEAQSLALRRELGYRPGIAECLVGFAELLRAEGQPERAARLLGAVDALCHTIGYALPRLERASFERGMAVLREALGEERFGAAWTEGRALALERALEYTLATGDGPDDAGRLSSENDIPGRWG